MAIYLDSALTSEAEVASLMGWVKGITTNPALLAKSDNPPETTLKKLASLTSGPVFYQLMATDFDGMVAEGRKAFEIVGEQMVLKIPATPIGFQVVACLKSEIICSVTAIYSAAQAAIAKEAGAKYAIAYVNRATRLLGDGLALVREMGTILQGSRTEILAASIKSPAEAAATLMAGAHHLTIPLSVLQAMSDCDLSIQTVSEFSANGIGIDFK